MPSVASPGLALRTRPGTGRGAIAAWHAAGLSLLLGGCTLPQGQPATPQRPTFCFGPTTTAAGTLELEGGLSIGPPDDDWDAPNTLKYGIDEHTEVSASLTSMISVDHTQGLGDAGLAWRHRVVDAEGTRPAVALLASLKLPTASEDRGLGTGHTDAFGGITAGGSIGRFGWITFAQLGALGQAGEDADVESDFSLMGSWTLDPVNSMFAEFSQRTVHEQGSYVGQLRLGHYLTVRPDLVLDWSVWLPTTHDAQETVFAVGFTRNFGAP